MGRNEDKIAELKKELAKYSEKDQARLKSVQDQQEIRNLKRQIRKKKYAGLVHTGKNLKVIGKNMVTVTKAMGKGLGKFVGEDPKRRSMEEVLKDMPQ